MVLNMWNSDSENIQILGRRVDALEKHDMLCDEKHRRVDDKILTMAADLSKIRENTEKSATGEAAKAMLKNAIIQLSALFVAMTIIWEPVGKLMRHLLSLGS